MARTITINGQSYPVPEVDFNAVCELQERGVDVMNPKSIRKRHIPVARAIVAWIMDTDVEEAGIEIQEHILNGGDLAPIFEGFWKEVEESNFFKSLQKKEKGAKVELLDHQKKQRAVKED